jgi:hypothetical protein
MAKLLLNWKLGPNQTIRRSLGAMEDHTEGRLRVRGPGVTGDPVEGRQHARGPHHRRYEAMYTCHVVIGRAQKYL